MDFHMPANINYNDQTNQHAFMSVKQKAWHGLGQIIDSYPTSAESLIYAGLNFTVDKLPNIQRLPGGQETISKASFFNYRTDTGAILGDRIGADYQIIQNIDAFTFFDSIVGGGDGILYETAGALGNGERIFITAKLPDYIKVGNDDLIEKYIFLTTSHDGTGSVTAAFTPVRVVCANTLAAAMRDMSNTVRIRHTTGARERLKQAHKVMGISNKLADTMQDIFNQWSKTRITDPQVKRLIQIAMAPNKETLDRLQMGDFEGLSTTYKNTVDKVFEYAMSSPTQQSGTTKGTVFGSYNAVTGYFQNVCAFKNEEAKVDSIMYGGNAQTRTQKAFNLCSDFTAIGADALSYN
jgi:phage/plasmid-like protein (TIGR03299 family)